MTARSKGKRRLWDGYAFPASATHCSRAERISPSKAGRHLRPRSPPRSGSPTAYLLKESFEQLWSYQHEGWARRFFENWRTSLKWQRLNPYEKFAQMIERHGIGITAYCEPQNKAALGFVEGLNNKVRVIQRRAYGLRDGGLPALEDTHLYAAAPVETSKCTHTIS